MLKLERAVPKRVRDFFRARRMFLRAWRHLQGGAFAAAPAGVPALPPDPANPFRRHAESLRAGPGLWKWDHYFDIYQRHFEKFRGRDVHVVEIGVYSGGSLGLWHDYFGPRAHVYGIDIDPACAVYAGPGTRIFIGDQIDRAFWRRFRQEVPAVDILIDDGSHYYEHQIVPLEEMFPHLAPGGVYMCEDISGVFNGMSLYLNAHLQRLNEARWRKEAARPGEPELLAFATPFQQMVKSIHLYPFAAVIEKHDRPQARLFAKMHGSEFRPPAV
jgi:hypothetical protein